MPCLLLLSEKPSDVDFGGAVASANGWELLLAKTRDDLRTTLLSRPDAVVFWDAESSAAYEASGEILPKYVKAQRIFAITDRSLETYPHLFNVPVFGHHLVRRFDDPALTIYSRLAAASLRNDPIGMATYFPAGTQTQKIPLKQSVFKRAAIEAIQNFLKKQGLAGRLASAVAQAVDELILNALFDAPVLEDGTPFRHGKPRDLVFELGPREEVSIEFASAETYMGICVSDSFGSLRKRTVLGSLRKHLEAAFEEKSHEVAAGLGIYGIMQSGLSLMLICKPRVRTEAILLFQRTDSYKTFRSGFRFLTLID